MKKQYKVVFLDWSETLSSSKFWEHILDMDIRERIETGLFNDLNHLLDPWMRGKYTSENITEILSSKSGIDSNYLLNELMFSCRKMKFVSTEVPNLVKRIQSKGIKVVIATDNMDTFSRWTVPAMKLNKMFDGILNSFDLKVLKKDILPNGKSAFFNEYFITNNLCPSDTILVDDSIESETIIRGFGMDYYNIEKGIGLTPALKELI